MNEKTQGPEQIRLHQPNLRPVQSRSSQNRRRKVLYQNMTSFGKGRKSILDLCAREFAATRREIPVSYSESDVVRGMESAHVILETPPDLNDESHANLDTSFHQVFPDRNLPAFNPVRSHESSSKLALHPLEIGFYFGVLIRGVRTVGDFERIRESCEGCSKRP